MSSDIGRLHVRRNIKRAVGKKRLRRQAALQGHIFYIIPNTRPTVKKKETPLTRALPAGYAGENNWINKRYTHETYGYFGGGH